jgi:hypothetical protein
LKPGRSFSEEDEFDMMDSCHPRDSKAEEEEEATMAEDWRQKVRKRRKRATKDADCLWGFNGMQDAEWRETFENDSNRLRAYRRKCRYKLYINDDGSNNRPNPDDPENNGYYPEYCFICHQMPCYLHQEEEDWNGMFGDPDKLNEVGNLMTPVDVKQYRLYSIAASKLYGRQGVRRCKKLPLCVELDIKKNFPSENNQYVGFREADEEA